MPAGPSKRAEAIVALLTPPACREEVLGDLYERFRSSRQYFLDALRTVPLVILSRVRRTADPQAVTLQGLFLYLGFLAAAWIKSRDLLRDERHLGSLLIPAGAALLGLIVNDAYSRSSRRSTVNLVRGPLVGVGMALLSQLIIWASRAVFVIPLWTLVYGCAFSFVVSCAIRALFSAALDKGGPSPGSRRGSPS